MLKNKEILETKIINENNNGFPELLRRIKNSPQILYVKGNISLLNKPSIAIVGSRNYSEYGKKMAKKFTKGLVNEGFAIVSGLARGIDSFAHEECINSGGKTIAVIAGGFNYIYPEENKKLYEKILRTGGCIITEYPPDVEAKKEYFPTRNRIISGLSLGTLVIEASFRSGTSITARYCMQQNRKLFCIPNSIESKNATGTNNLIKRGANLVTKVEDIIQTIGTINNKVEVEQVDINEKKDSITLSGNELLVFDKIKDKPKFADEIAIKAGLSITDVNIILSILEIENYIVKLPNNMYKVKEYDE